MSTEFCWGNLSKRDNLEDIGTDRRIILKWMFKTYNEECGLD
jgi:hypothetical protein